MPSTTSYQTGDLLLVDFQFTVTGQSKMRPALVILDTGDADVLLARVTTQVWHTRYDVPIVGWKQAGLWAPSIVRLHKMATLATTRVQRQLGKLEVGDCEQVSAVGNRGVMVNPSREPLN